MRRDAWQYRFGPGADVLIVTYGCYTDATGVPVVSREHDRIGLFTEGEVGALRLPGGYRRAIAAWFAHLRRG